VLVEVVGGGSNPIPHFTPLVRANKSYNPNRRSNDPTLIGAMRFYLPA